MSIPIPSSPIEGHCSAIHDDVLYVLSPNGFLSLPLKEGAEWSKEAQGELVTGHACVKVVPDNNPSQTVLYVIGGTTDNSNYSGLQRYSFADKKWDSLSPVVNVLQGRTNHSAAYLHDSQSILVYAGSQPKYPSFLSSQTFLVSTQEPYNIEAYTSEAPPTNIPILQTWNSSHALMTGGSQDNGIYTFAPGEGWQRYGTNLTHTLDPSARGSIIDGTDGSKVLQVFEMNVSPNVVSSIPLLDANGQPAATGQTVGGGSSSRKRKRDLTLNNWPTYNSTGAPTATRSDCSVSQNTDGLAVIAAGSSDAPIALFDPSKNGWVDANKFFNSKNQQPLQPSGTSDSGASATSSSEPSSTSHSDPAASSASHSRTMRTLGITLGVLAGIAVLFILILLFFRWRRMKSKKTGGYVDEKQDGRMSFADRGASFMKEAGGHELVPPNQNRFNNPHDSRSSLAIIAGRFGGNKRNTATISAPKQSFESTARLVNDTNGVPLAGEPVEMVNMQEKAPIDAVPRSPRRSEAPPVAYHNYGANLTAGDATKGMRKRSSGWSRYFASNTPGGPNGLSHIPSVYVKPQHMSDASEYTIDRRGSEASLQAPSSAALVDGQRLSHVATGSPAFSDSRKTLMTDGTKPAATRGQKGHIVDPDKKRRGSTGSDSRTISTDSSVLSSVLTDDHGGDEKRAWSPTRNQSTNTKAPRPVSSNYTASVYYEPHQHPTRGKGSIGFFPGPGTTYRPRSKSQASKSARPSLDGPTPPPVFPQQVASVAPFARPAEDRDSTVTVFPRGMPAAYYGESENKENSTTALPRKQQPPAKTNTPPRQPGQSEGDMSWLNLGLGGAQSRS